MERKKQESEITSIILNEATYINAEVETPTFVNFFFGNNGTGKSTIATSIAGKTGLGFRTGKSEDDYQFLVYNEEFITDNMRRYDNMPGVFTLSKEKGDIQDQIDAEIAKKRDKKSEEEKKKKEQIENGNKLTSAFEALRDKCWENTRAIRDTFKKAMTKKQKEPLANALLDEKNPQLLDLTAFAKKCDAAYDDSAKAYDLLKTISGICTSNIPGYNLLSTPIISRSESEFAKFIKALNATDWVNQGHQHYTSAAHGKCPFCQQKLPNSFEDDIASCFDEQYQADISQLQTFQFQYKQATDYVLSILSSNLMTDVRTDLSDAYTAKLEVLKKTIELNQQAIKGKVAEPGSSVTIEDIDALIDELNKIIADINKLIKDHNDIVASQKDTQKECAKQILQHIAAFMKTEIDRYRSEKAKLEAESRTIKDELDVIQKDIIAIDTTIADLNQRSANTELTVKSINQILKDAGFQGFQLREKAGTKDVYEVIRSNGRVAKKLSEGERNFIAFLYFYHKVKGLDVPAEGLKDKIVVIDDPVSSMDSSTLFIVSALVREMVEICRNNIDGDNKEVNGDYIKQIFILTHNAYFHREVTYNQVNRYEYVNFYLIRKVDNISTIKLCVQPNPNAPTQDVNVNPVKNSYAALWSEFKNLNTTVPLLNVIRQILEYYFLQLCGYEGKTLRDKILKENRDSFVTVTKDSKEDTTDLNIVSSMLSYINANSIGFNDGYTYVDDGTDAERCKEIFHKIFLYMEQGQHYDMMMDSQ